MLWMLGSLRSVGGNRPWTWFLRRSSFRGDATTRLGDSLASKTRPASFVLPTSSRPIRAPSRTWTLESGTVPALRFNRGNRDAAFIPARRNRPRHGTARARGPARVAGRLDGREKGGGAPPQGSGGCGRHVRARREPGRVRAGGRRPVPPEPPPPGPGGLPRPVGAQAAAPRGPRGDGRRDRVRPGGGPVQGRVSGAPSAIGSPDPCQKGLARGL